MREIARCAGVTHAALAYQFGDKAGLFTAIATEGFRLATAAIGSVATGSNGFIQGGIAYTVFALTHPGYFEVMFRPDLHRADDQDLVEARAAAFAILDGSARASLDGAPDEEVSGVVVTGWSLVHGLAALARTGYLDGRISDDPTDLAAQITQGVVRLADLAGRYRETHTAAQGLRGEAPRPPTPGS
jgi:AcrR family transcriptional regulator